MKISRDGPLPQFELGPHLGGLKVLYQRAGSLVFQPITMVGAMMGAWGTNPGIRELFLNSLLVYFGTVAVVGVITVTLYYVAILPSEQSFNQGQSQRPERSPLKRDTEAIRSEVEALNTRLEKHGLEVAFHPSDSGGQMETDGRGDD